MKRFQLPTDPWGKFAFVVVLWGMLFLASTLAFAETRAKKSTVSTKSKTFSGSYAISGINPIPAQALSNTTTATPEKRVINLRIHPTHLATMIIDKDTVVSLRGDLDFVLGEKVTLGAAVIYHQTSSYDDASRVRNEAQVEAGLLSNIYLTGRTTEGGFLFRPHVFYVEPTGERTDESGALKEFTARETGVRGGAELIFQHILSSGFNFEVGGGFSYHFKPYSLQYAGSNNPRTEPASRIVPTVSIGVGWIF